MSSTDTTARTISNATTLNGTTGVFTLGDATRNGKLTFTNTVSLGNGVRRVAANSDAEFAGVVSGSGGISKLGTGTLILSAINDYSGATTVIEGTLKLDYTVNGSKLLDTAALTLAGGTLELSGGSHPEVVASTTLSPNTTPSTVTRSSGSSVLQMNAITRQAGATINFAQSGIATTDTLNNANGILGTWATVGGTDWAVNQGNTTDSPVIALSSYMLTSDVANNAASYAGANISVNSNQSPDAGISPNTLRFNGPGALTLTLQGANTIASGGILVGTGTGTNTSTLNGGTITGPLNGDFVINQANPDANLVISSSIINNGTTNVVKIGAGPATLAGANSYTGSTTVGGGTLTVSTGGAINVGGSSTVGTASIVGGATLRVDGGAVTFRGNANTVIGTGNATTNGHILVQSGSLTLNNGRIVMGQGSGATDNNLPADTLTQTNGTITMNSNTTSYIGNYTPSTMTLSGGTFSHTANTFVVGTRANTSLTVSGSSEASFGTLQMGNSSTTNVIAINLNGGTLAVNTITQGGSGNNGANVFNFNGGILKARAASTTFFQGADNTFIKSGGATIDSNTFNITIGQILRNDPASPGGGLTKNGTGTLFLTGANTYTGATTVTAGTLSLGNGTTNTGLANAADVVVAASATLNLNYTGTDTIDELTINGVAKTPGVWGSAASGAPNTDTQLTGTGTLTVSTGPSASAYDQWATVTYGLSGGNAAFDFDYDNDGLDNGLEWILGGNPTTSSTTKAPMASRNLAGDLVLTFTREETSISESTLKVLIGTDLTTWPKEATVGATTSGPDANGVTVSINDATTPDTVTVTIPATNAVSGKIFARVKATKP